VIQILLITAGVASVALLTRYLLDAAVHWLSRRR